MKEREGVHLCMYMYYIVSLCYRTARWMFTKLGRDQVLITPHLCLDFSANPAQGGSSVVNVLEAILANVHVNITLMTIVVHIVIV